MKRPDTRLLDGVLRTNFVAFIMKVFQEVSPGNAYEHNWHIDVIADRLIQCESGDIKRLIINIPPRHLKSICTSIAFPAWLLGHHPTARIICVSYAEDLSSSLARDCKRVMETAWYKRLFPETRLRRSADMNLETTKGGARYATTVGGSITGLGGDYIIIDDALKPIDALSDTLRSKTNDWFTGTLYSRLNNKNKSVIIIVMQRLHVDDLVSHVQKTEDWDILSLPAIAVAPEVFELTNGNVYERDIDTPLQESRESHETLVKIEKTIGEYNFSAQYQQQPMSPEGNIIKWKWFKFHDIVRLDRADHIVQSWDTASKVTEHASYSVGITFLKRGDDYYILDVFRDKLDFPDLYEAVKKLYWQYKPRSILIEDKSSGTQLIQQIRKHQPSLPSPTSIIPKVDKAIRMESQCIKLREGRVFLLQDAPWLAEFKAEVLAFPYGTQQDQVDALSQFLQWQDNRKMFRIAKLEGI